MADPTKRVNYEEVARLARDAMTRGVSARQYVASVLGITVKHAAQTIYRSRVAGYDVPKLTRRPKYRVEKGETFDVLPVPDSRTYIQLMCTTCYATFGVEEYSTFMKHIVSEHKRYPLKEEKTPVEVLGKNHDCRNY